MIIKLDIQDKSFKNFEEKINKINLFDAKESLFIILSQCLNNKNIIVNNISLMEDDNTKATKPEVPDIFLYIEEKMKKYRLYQSSLAACLKTTQASVSRTLKNKNKNSKLYREAIAKKDRLLICAYFNQYKEKIDLSEIDCDIPKNTLDFFESILHRVKEEYSYMFNFSMFKESLCKFLDDDAFLTVNFNKLHNDIDLLTKTIEEITQKYFFDVYAK